MRRTIKETTLETTFNNHPIMTDKERGLGCDTKILTEIDRQFEQAENSATEKSSYTIWIILGAVVLLLSGGVATFFILQKNKAKG